MKALTLIFFALLSFHSFANDWRTPSPENLVYLDTDAGRVVIELAPFVAPNHVQRFKTLVKEGFYDGLDFYRVIDGFVVQGGDMAEQKVSENKSPLKAEFTRAIPKDSAFKLVQSPDFMAPETGFLNGFAAGRDPQSKEEWLLHCPGTVAMARSNDADSGTTDFYIVIGQATRHLDRNMSSFGKVIYGMDAVQSIKRAHLNNASGVIEKPQDRSKIVSAKMAADVPADQRLNIEVQDENGEAVNNRLASARKLDNAFFHFKGNGNLDVCYYNLKSRVVDADSE